MAVAALRVRSRALTRNTGLTVPKRQCPEGPGRLPWLTEAAGFSLGQQGAVTNSALHMAGFYWTLTFNGLTFFFWVDTPRNVVLIKR